MNRCKTYIRDIFVTIFVLVVTFLINLVLQKIFKTQSFSSDVFILGVFLISLKTEGYVWGILASMLSVLAENFAFTFPFFTFNLMAAESLSSAVVMLIVAVSTSTLTTKIKEQERTKAENEKERVRENLLSITRIGSKKVQVIKTPTVLEEFIDDTLIKFHKRYPSQKVEVEIPEEFISIPMDPLLIVQVLMNLLENAVLHAEGMTNLRFTVKKSGKWAVFSIEDDGCGIPAEVLGKMFDGYHDRAGELMDGKRNNMSIGLSVCATIIRAHGGKIKAENRREGGARFSFSLEMEEMDE